jgi:shikimate dehydrogenase
VNTVASPSGGRAAVLGSPIEHSLSPLLHRAAYQALGLTDWRYDAIECREDGLAALLRDAPADVVGYSCTMPLKRVALELADSASEQATAIGAANTLLRIDDEWFADNTDWIGVRDCLAEREVPVTGRVALIGAGGTAQAALAALTESEDVVVLVREPSRAAALLAAAARLDRPVRLALIDEFHEVDAAELVISTVPRAAAEALAELAAWPWRADQALLDVVYDPWPTALAAAFRRAGAPVVSGAAMLLRQAVRQVELMTGRAAPVPAMRAALRAASPGSGLDAAES